MKKYKRLFSFTMGEALKAQRAETLNVSIGSAWRSFINFKNVSQKNYLLQP